ncbi:hypothetical protein [Spiribacter onubensis]|uniref:Uncharacterized protein n=1 Tax=Spiribacter onubensis TaxID=3122420 RepID=A0ABV3SCD0_9GAMM
MKTYIADFAAISSIEIPGEMTQRPASDVLPACALSKSAPKHRTIPVALSTNPVLMREDEAGERHLNTELIHRPWIDHGENGAQTDRAEPFSQRFHPDRPVFVLLIDADDLASPTHQEVVKDLYQVIKPAAEGLPDHNWRDVLKWFFNHPRKQRVFAEVLFNQPAEVLSARQIRALLADAVSLDSVQRALKPYERAAKEAAKPKAADDTPVDPKQEPEPEPEPEPAQTVSNPSELAEPTEPSDASGVDGPTVAAVEPDPHTPAEAPGSPDTDDDPGIDHQNAYRARKGFRHHHRRDPTNNDAIDADRSHEWDPDDEPF